jgi:hypothetical protein
MSSDLLAVFEDAKKLPVEEKRELATLLLDDIKHSLAGTDRNGSDLAIVDQLFGSLKGLDRETVKWLAEDEELCGY